jgi:hypothetical protein
LSVTGEIVYVQWDNTSIVIDLEIANDSVRGQFLYSKFVETYPSLKVE